MALCSKLDDVDAADKRQSYALAMPATVNEDGGGGSSSSIASFRWHWMAVKEVDGDMNVGRAVCVNSQKSSAKAVPVIEWLSRVESSRRVESSSRVVE